MSAVPRRKIAPAEEQRRLALVAPPEDSPDSFARAGKPRRPRTVPDKLFADARERARAMVEANDWVAARAVDFVALFAAMHERVYGVTLVISSKDRFLAACMAAALQREQFDGDPTRLADFVWWTWRREREREAWRRENNRPTTPISWRLQFGLRLINDYRVAMARERSRKGGA